MGTRSPWWRMVLQQWCPFLFRVCGQGNYHWRWDRLCWCGVGIDGQSFPRRLRHGKED
jgi:hypothetical protein